MKDIRITVVNQIVEVWALGTEEGKWIYPELKTAHDRLRAILEHVVTTDTSLIPKTVSLTISNHS